MRASRIIAALSVALAACATEAGYVKVLETWKGGDANDLIRSWGRPRDTFRMPNGNTVLVYSSASSFTMPVQATSSTNYDYYGNSRTTTSVTGGQTYNYSCETQFEISERTGRIVHWNFRGNNCRAIAPEEPAKVVDRTVKPRRSCISTCESQTEYCADRCTKDRECLAACVRMETVCRREC